MKADISSARSPGPAAVSIRAVGKTFGTGFQALSDINLDIREGQFLSIVGASGCGKSTLLQIVAGLTAASSGQVLLGGTPIVGPRPREVAVVFQDALLLPWKTTLQNVEFPLDLQRVSAAERRAKSIEMLDLVGLADFAANYPHQLSGGMRQRVSIARGLAQDPRIILMDEPFGALDELTRIRMGQELLRIWERSRKTVMFITHSLTEAIFLSDVVVVMGRNPGRILERIAVPLPRPRTADVMGGDVFGQLRNRIWHLLTEEIERTDTAPSL
jgi:NitT/TauT family transport system ATP-binding protein